jgi:O-antigen ligase
MSTYRMGFWALMAYLLIDFGQVHRMIPGMKYLMPGALTTVILLALVLIELPRGLNAPGGTWLRPIVLWRVLFLGAIATGLLLAVTQGRALMVLKTEVPRFLTAFLGACIFIRRVEDLRALHNMFILTALLLSGWVIAHHGHGPGLYIDENDVALVLVMLLPFSFLKVFADGTGGIRKAVIPLGVFLLTLIAIGLTLSRGGMVGAMPALVFCWLKTRNKAVSLILGCLALGVALLFAPKNFKTEFESISDTHESTAEARRYYWELSVQMFEKRPVFGVGAMCWGNALYSGLLPSPDRRAHMTPHSIYFQLLSELGLVGVFCWMGFLTATFRELRDLRGRRLEAGARMSMAGGTDPAVMQRMTAAIRYLRHFSACLAIGILGYLVSGGFLSVLFYPGLALFAALAQASGRVWRTELLVASLQSRAGIRADEEAYAGSAMAGPALEGSGP